MKREVLVTEPQQATHTDQAADEIESILAAAHALVVDAGTEALSLPQVATLAGIPIESVVPYFPDKPAVILGLVQRFMRLVRQGLVEGLSDLETAASAIERVDGMLAGYVEVFVHDTALGDFWAAAQTDKHFPILDFEDSRENARVIVGSLQHLIRPEQHGQLEKMSLFVAHHAGVCARLAIQVGGDESRASMGELRRLIRRDLEEILVDRSRR